MLDLTELTVILIYKFLTVNYSKLSPKWIEMSGYELIWTQKMEQLRKLQIFYIDIFNK